MNLERPSVFLNAKEIARLCKEVKTISWKRELYEKDSGRPMFLGGTSIKATADRWLNVDIQIPERSGHFHNFFCKDGNMLELPEDLKPRPEGYKCPVCGQIYKGEKYDGAVRWRAHNELSVAAFDLALTYVLEDDIQYARKAAEILIKYANAYPGPHTSLTAGGIMYQSLCEAVWVIPLAAAYDLVYNELSENEKTEIETKLFRPVAEGLRNMGIGGNWGSWHLSAVGVIGYAIKDKELIQYALESFKSQIDKQLGDDGLWPESVHTYHFYPMNAFLYLAEAALHNGTDLYNWEAKLGKGLKAMFIAPLNYAYPNFQLPAINDGWFKSFLPLGLYELAYARYDDPMLGWVLKQGYDKLKSPRASLWALLHGRSLDKNFKEPSFKSINFPVLGIAVLRSQNGNMITFDYGPHLGHGQRDKMGITLFAYGKPLVLDYGTPGYGSEIMQWYVSTPAHNTVVVDCKNQATTKERRLTCFNSGDIFEVAEAETEEAYPGVLHRRTVIRVENYFIMVDHLESEEEHSYDWFLRCEGDLTIRMVPTTEAPPISYKYVEQLASFAPKGPWQARWKTKDGGLGLFMLDDSPSLVYSTECPAESGTRKVPLIVSRKKGKTATFTAILFPYLGSLRVTATLKRGLIEVNHDGVTDWISIEPHTAERPLLTDGRYAFVRTRDSKPLCSSIIGGSYLDWNEAKSPF